MITVLLIAAFENPWCSCLFNMDGAVKMIGMELACRWTDNSNGMPPWLPSTAAQAAGPLLWGVGDRPGHSRFLPQGHVLGGQYTQEVLSLTNIWENIGA